MRDLFEDLLKLFTLGALFFTFQAYMNSDFPGYAIRIGISLLGGFLSYIISDYAEKRERKFPD